MGSDSLEESKFRDWCSLKEPKLTRYILINSLKETTNIMFFPFMIIFFLLIVSILERFIFDIRLTAFISGVCSFALVLALMFSGKLLGFSMTRIEFISCLLNKISKEIELCKTANDKKDLIRDLKTLSRYLHYDLRLQFPNIALFKNDINKLKCSIELFRILPKYLLIKVKKGLIGEINYKDISKFSYYIYTDDSEKVNLLKKITEGYEDAPKFRFKTLSVIKKVKKTNFSRLTLYSIILFILVYFVLFKSFGLDKNVSAIIFVGFWAPLFNYLLSRKT